MTTRMIVTAVRAALLGAVGLLLAACGDDTAVAEPQAAAKAGNAAVEAEGAPAPAAVATGVAADTSADASGATAVPTVAVATPTGVAAPTAAPTASAEAAAPAVTAAGPAYDVSCPDGATRAEDCEVGQSTYVGWRSFHAHCQQCHGGSALGSTFAPNLLERFNTRVDYARFQDVLHHGYTGNVGAMPSFEKNSAVLKDLEPIYQYLRARADGKLPPGRPLKKS